MRCLSLICGLTGWIKGCLNGNMLRGSVRAEVKAALKQTDDIMGLCSEFASRKVRRPKQLNQALEEMGLAKELYPAVPAKYHGEVPKILFEVCRELGVL